jgi:hypothetical protein
VKIRNIAANRLATGCLNWSDLYQRWNSGTYNNQNMCFDYNKFAKGAKLQPGTFVISEQIPGHLVTNDLSEMLDTERYFGSYNTAFDPRVRAWSGADAKAKAYGNWFDYRMTARVSPHTLPLTPLRFACRNVKRHN